MSNGIKEKNNSILKTVSKYLGALAVLAIAAVFCLPWFFSTSTGKGILIKIISEKSGFNVEIEDLSLSWLGPQSANKINAQNPKEKITASCQEVTTDASLWSLFKNDVGHLKLVVPFLQTTRTFTPSNAQAPKEFLKRDSQNLLWKPNLGSKGVLQFPLKKTTFKPATLAVLPSIEMANIPIKGHILVEKGKVELNLPGLEPIHFDEIALTLDRATKEEVALILNCTTNQQGVLGSIAAKGSASRLNASFPSIALQASVTQLPVLGIDQLASIFAPKLSGLIYTAIGSKIDMQCNLVLAKGNFDLSLNAQSPQMSVRIATKTEGGIISLKSPATFNFNLTPALLQKVAKLVPSVQPLILNNPALIEGTLSQFSCTIPTKAEDLLKCSLQAKMAAQAPLSLKLNGAALALNTLSFTANTPLLEKEITLSLNSSLQTEAQTGGLAIQGNILAPFSNAPKGTLSVNADKLPTDLIAIVSGSSTLLSPFLGPTADVKGTVHFNKANPTLHLSWQSQFLNIPSFDLSLSNTLTLLSPAKFTFGLNPKALSEGQIKLIKTSPFEGILQSLVIPPDIKNTRIEAIINTEKLSFSGAFPLNISNVEAMLQIKTLDQILFTIKSTPLQASLSGAFKPNTSEFVLNKPLSIQYTLDGPSLSTLVPSAPALAKPATIQLFIDPFSFPLSKMHMRAMNLKGKLSSPQVALNSQGNVITLQDMSVPFQWDAESKTASLQLTSQVQNPSGDAGSMQGQFILSNFLLENGINLNRASIIGSLDLQNLSSKLLDAFYRHAPLSVIIGPIFSSKMKFQSTIDKQNIAIKWVSPNLNIDSAFVIDNTGLQLQGTTNQLSWILTPESYKVLDQMITGPKWMSFRNPESSEIELVSSKKNRAKNNAPNHQRIEPKAPAKPQPSPFEISEPSTFLISLSKLSLPVIAKQEMKSLGSRIPHIVFDLTKLQLNATGRNTKLSFLDKTSKETIQLTNISFSVNKPADKGPLTASFDSGVVTLSGSTAAPESVKNGSISLDGKLLQPSNNSGIFDLSQLICSLQMKIQQLPSRALDIIARVHGRTDLPFSTTFGEMINATAAFDLKNFSGPFSMNINTPRTRLDIEGNLANGAVLLKNTAHAQMKITPDLSRLVLKEVNPLNLSYFYSQDPITLEIPAAGFYLPLHPFDLSKVTIPKAKIELGKIACKNEGNVNITLGLLKNKQVNKGGELGLWFAPIDLSIKQGIVDIERTEILLADSFDICTWGKIDLVKDYVDMILGLTAQTLGKAFGIQNLPENYVLTLPMKGPSNNVQINTDKATTKVALLLAWQTQSRTGIGGDAGAILGGLLGKIATLPDSNAKVPPPKHPFPWEVSRARRTSDTPHEKKKQFKTKDKPLKQILKVIR